jgi:type VI secretion system protein ImpL
MMLWVFVVIALAAIWGIGWFFGVSLLWKILATLVVALFVAAVFLFRRWRAGRAAKALEAELLRQAEQQARDARPDRRAEIEELQQRFQKGLASLKSSKLSGATGAEALYALPWYLIIGPPGAGKTTALKHSGLDFPFEGGTAIKGLGGTRNCDWWFANEAILLDTAGRYATQEDDHEEWIAFLGMLKKFRSKKPVNGVLVAISVTDLASSSEEQIEAIGRRLRTRIDEVMTRLEMVVPVYLMFTKVDLVAGFSAFWGNLRKSERAQLWGATFPLETPKDFDPGKAIGRELEVLLESLHARSIALLGKEKSHEAKPQIFQFPIELEALKNGLVTLAASLFQKNAYQETPIFRGFYLTSGTQEGRPMDLVVGGMARAFGLRSQGDVQAPSKESKSYFVTDLFRKVVFPDKNVAGRTARETRRLALRRLAWGGLAASVGLAIIGPGACTYRRNSALVEETSAVARDAAKVSWDRGAALESVTQLDRLRGQLQKLYAWRDGAPVGMRWGMYVGDVLYGPLRNVYLGSLRTGFEQVVRKDLENRLRVVDASTQTSADAYNKAYDTLKMYLMLGDRSHLDPVWLAPRLPIQWVAALHSPPDPKLEDAMRPHVDFYLELMKSGEVAPWQLDKDLVARARSILLQVSQLDRDYEALVRDANSTLAAIKMESIFYGGVAPYVSSRKHVSVPGAYTKAGWLRIRPMLDAKKSSLAAERWVLGEGEAASAADAQKQVEKLRDIYFERYKNAWHDFLVDIEVQRPANAEKALDELQALSEPEWPYLRLLRALHENVTLEIDEYMVPANATAQKLADQAVEAAKKKILGAAAGSIATPQLPLRTVSPVEKAFQPLLKFAIPADAAPGVPPPPTGLSQYQGILAKLIGVMTDLRDSKAAPDTKALAGEFQESFRSTSTLLADQDGYTRPLLSPLLMRPITLGYGAVLNDAGGAVGGLWELNVWNKWQTALDKKYPFVDSPNEVALADFAEFFKPKDGQLWGFYEASLKGTLEKQGGKFVPDRRFKASIPYTGPFLTCLERGLKITDAMFSGGDKPLVEMEINLHSVSPEVSEITLEIDGTPISYKNTPEEWVKVTWPAKDAKARGAKLRARGFAGLDEEISRPGDFGFLRILDAAKIENGAPGKPGAPPTLVATWDLTTQVGGNVKIDIRPAKVEHPLQRSLFRGFTCPRVITGAP